MDRPLAGFRVVDLTRYLSGPYATLQLAEMGAEVIKVEMPVTGDDTRHIAPLKGGVSYYHSSVNRSKASVELDLKSPADLETLRAMIADADVLVENFRAGVLDRLGLGYEAVSLINPRLVYCAITGFDSKGPQSRRAAFDLIVQGESGVMSLNGDPARNPEKIGIPVADISAGMFAVQGILAALLRRGRSGKGGLVEVNMLSSLLSLSGYNPGLYFLTGNSPSRVGSRHHTVVPYGPYPTADGLILLSTFSDGSWKKIVEALDRPELAGDSRFDTAPGRAANRDACETLIVEMLSAHPSREVVRRLEAAGVPCGIVRSLGEAIEIEKESGTGSIAEIDYGGEAAVIPGVRIPVKFDGEWCPVAPAPALGRDNAMLERYRDKLEEERPSATDRAEKDPISFK